MNRTLGILSVAALLATGGAAVAQKGGSEAQQTANPPATGSATTSPTYDYQQGRTAQSNTYPGGVGPTGSHQPDATNPVRSNPSGGGGTEGGANGGAGGGNTH